LNVSKFVIFTVAHKEFGIPLERIVEIVKSQKITNLPKLPSFISGVINLRGAVIPLIDLRKRLGVEPVSLKERVIILKMHEEKIGLLVDDVKEIMDIEKEHIATPPSLFKGLKPEYLLSIGKIADRLVVILNIETLLTSEEMILLEESKETLFSTEAAENISQEKEEKEQGV
ncbi:MAG: purine-binding chemotaxis protein CheW, partial [Thermodesulfovibrionia bacterium]|nr:purine-binding chemotaxis protein CheW [Thermodesulfovibrionia bacterium]